MLGGGDRAGGLDERVLTTYATGLIDMILG